MLNNTNLVKKFLKLFFAFSILSILVYLYFRFDPINNLLFPKCPLYVSTGLYCPGCGSQRATHALLHFDIIGIFKSNLLFLPAMLLVGYHLVLKTINYFIGTAYTSFLDRSNAPLIILAIVILYWIARNLPYTFFDVLRP